jgi:plasmid stability protein
VNVRVDDREFDELFACAFIEGRSLPEELRAAVRAHIATLEDNPHFEAALAARHGRNEEKTGGKAPVSSLDARRKRERRREV